MSFSILILLPTFDVLINNLKETENNIDENKSVITDFIALLKNNEAKEIVLQVSEFLKTNLKAKHKKNEEEQEKN